MRYTDEEVHHIMYELGFADVRSSSSGVLKARCDCSSKDDRTFVVIVGDPPGYHCHRCKRSGSLPDMVWDAWFSGKKLLRSILIVSAHYQTWLLEEEAVPPTRLEYIPLASKPGIKPSERARADEPVRSIYGSQLNLEGKVTIEEARPLDEADLEKFKSQPSDYLLKRGLSRATQEAYGVRVNPWGHRAVFPIRDWSGGLVGLSQRRVYEGPNCPKCGADIGTGADMKYKCACGTINAKYMHSKGFRKSAVLYGEWLHATGCVPVIVEGMTDVQNLYENGLRPPLALPLAVMGGSAAESQVRRVLEKFPTGPVFIIRDHDDPSKYKDLPPGKAPGDLMAEGVEAAIKLLAPERQVVHVVPALGKDPGDLTRDEVEVVIDAICMERGGIILV